MSIFRLVPRWSKITPKDAHSTPSLSSSVLQYFVSRGPSRCLVFTNSHSILIFLPIAVPNPSLDYLRITSECSIYCPLSIDISGVQVGPSSRLVLPVILLSHSHQIYASAAAHSSAIDLFIQFCTDPSTFRPIPRWSKVTQKLAHSTPSLSYGVLRHFVSRGPSQCLLPSHSIFISTRLPS